MAITAKTEDDAIFEIVNRQNGTTFSSSDTIVENLTPDPDISGSTEITLTAKPDAPFAGSVTVDYRRQPVSTIIDTLPPLEIPGDNAGSAEDIAKYIKDSWLSKSPVPWGEKVVITVDTEANKAKIDAGDNHYVAYGSYNEPFTILKNSLDSTIVTKDLDAFTEEDVTVPGGLPETDPGTDPEDPGGVVDPTPDEPGPTDPSGGDDGVLDPGENPGGPI